MSQSRRSLEAEVRSVLSVQQKQRDCATTYERVLRALENDVSKYQRALEAGSDSDRELAIRNADERQNPRKLYKEMYKPTQDLHAEIRKLDGVVSAAFPKDIHRELSPAVDFDNSVLNQVLAEHFFQTGQLAVASAFAEEAGISGAEEMRTRFGEMHAIIHELQSHNLEAALQWIDTHYGQLARLSGATATREFHFQLHKARFLQELERNGMPPSLNRKLEAVFKEVTLFAASASATGYKEAFAYGRAHLPQFWDIKEAEVQRCLGMLVFADRPACERYTDLFEGPDWEGVKAAFVREASGLLGRTTESPLLVAVAAGALSLPKFLEHAGLPPGKDWGQPEAVVAKDFIFHSVFVCPVGREQSNEDNPPMMLPCGHVLARQSIRSIIRGPQQRPFKCPSCPRKPENRTASDFTFQGAS